MSDRSATVTVDLGSTQMRAAIVAPDGEPLLPRSEPTPGAAPCPNALMDLASRSVITQSARGVTADPHPPSDLHPRTTRGFHQLHHPSTNLRRILRQRTQSRLPSLVANKHRVSTERGKLRAPMVGFDR